jgi:hypothetical protein
LELPELLKLPKIAGIENQNLPRRNVEKRIREGKS